MKQIVEQVKQGWRIFRELWANRRTRAMIIIGCYMFLFLFLISGIRTGQPSQELKKEEVVPTKVSLVSYQKMDNYEYTIHIGVKNSIGDTYYNLEGVRYQDKNQFELKGTGTTYALDKGLLYLVNGTNKQYVSGDFYGIYLGQIEPFSMANIIHQADLKSTISYADEGLKKHYTISISKFLGLYYNGIAGMPVVTNEASFISIDTYESNGVIEKVAMDFTPARSLVDPSVLSYFIEMNYMNIGKIKGLQ